MDSIWVSEAYDLGSIPGRATRRDKLNTFVPFLFNLKPT